MIKLILASKSQIRAQLLEQSGYNFLQIAANLDEQSLARQYNKNLVAGAGANKHLETECLALFLAKHKAKAISENYPEHYVIACDQTLEFAGEILYKPRDLTAVENRLSAFSGKQHYLRNGICIFKDGAEIWSYEDIVTLTMHELSRHEIQSYIREVGEVLLNSVSGYQLENKAIRFFKEIDGSYYSVLGLPLLPLLNKLREIS